MLVTARSVECVTLGLGVTSRRSFFLLPFYARRPTPDACGLDHPAATMHIRHVSYHS